MLEKIKEIVADQLGIDEDDIKLESNFNRIICRHVLKLVAGLV